MRLRAVVDHLEPVLVRDRLDRIDIDRDPVQVGHGDRLRLVRDLLLDVLRVRLVRILETIAEHHLRARRNQHRHRRDVRPSRRDHLIAGLEQRPIRKLERTRPVRARQPDLRIRSFSELFLERSTLRSSPEHPRFEHLVRRRDVLLRQTDGHKRHGLLESGGPSVDRQGLARRRAHGLASKGSDGCLNARKSSLHARATPIVGVRL